MFSIVIEENFNAEVIKRKQPVLLAYFNKDDDSREQLGVLENIAEKLGDQIKICLLSGNVNLEFRNLGISGSPTYIGFVNGKETGRMLGRACIDTLMTFVMGTLLKPTSNYIKKSDQILQAY